MGLVTLIAAAGESNELGREGDLVWHLPDDFKRFKRLTLGHHIIMGRKTFESFPDLLPGRPHIVITRQKAYQPEDVLVVHDLQTALDAAKADEQAFVIGGGEIYKLAMDLADRIELTRVHGNFKADTFFPEIDLSQWQLTEEEFHPQDERHQYSFTYLTYDRK